jgi:hypothetical protein
VAFGDFGGVGVEATGGTTAAARTPFGGAAAFAAS